MSAKLPTESLLPTTWQAVNGTQEPCVMTGLQGCISVQAPGALKIEGQASGLGLDINAWTKQVSILLLPLS